MQYINIYIIYKKACVHVIYRSTYTTTVLYKFKNSYFSTCFSCPSAQEVSPSHLSGFFVLWYFNAFPVVLTPALTSFFCFDFYFCFLSLLLPLVNLLTCCFMDMWFFVYYNSISDAFPAGLQERSQWWIFTKPSVIFPFLTSSQTNIWRY